MKVLYITDAYPTKEKVYSGIFPNYIAEELSKKIDIKVIKLKGRFRYSFIPTLFKTFFTTLSYKPDLVCAITVNTSGFIAAINKLFLRKKTIVYSRGTDIGVFPRKNKRNKSIIKFILKKADGLIVISKFLKEEAIKYGMKENKIHSVTTGVHLDQFQIKDNKKDLRKKLNLPKGNIIIYVGSIVPVKGIQDIIKPFSKIKNSNLLIIGKGQLENELKELCKKLNIEKRVIFLGQKNHNELKYYLKAADISIIPSRSEGLGNIIFEAMASGLPIIATKAGAIPEILNNNNAILVEPQNEEQIFNALEKLIKNKNLQKKLAKNNLKKVKIYDRKLAPDKFIKIFKNCLNR